ncbi:UNVERIFIED_ORG: YcaO-like family protein [Roseateles sp. XES5]|nr:YcaO-like family protein [Roseateles sp. XES5]
MSNNYRGYEARTPRFRVSAAYPVSIYEPAVFSAADPHAISGHGFGFDDDVHVKAIGEYLERYTAFRTIRPTHAGRFDEMNLSCTEQEALRAALCQTCQGGISRADMEGHSFRLVDVRRLGSGAPCLYPAVFLSLHSFDGRRDADILPVRDTSGSAIHPDRVTAYRSALLEFVERQCTTAMWVSRRCNDIAPLNESLIRHGKASVVCRQMMRNGTLTLYDISFLKGASVFFAEYRSRRAGDLVNFSCGCAADVSKDTAQLKALTEVWQTSLLLPQMEFFQMRDYGSDKLKEDFRAANRPDFELDVHVDPLRIGLDDADEAAIETLQDSLLSVSRNIYVYEKSVTVSGAKMWFCRIVSPDFFIHMSPGESNNNENRWIDIFCGAAARRLEPLPFS